LQLIGFPLLDVKLFTILYIEILNIVDVINQSYLDLIEYQY